MSYQSSYLGMLLQFFNDEELFAAFHDPRLYWLDHGDKRC